MKRRKEIRRKFNEIKHADEIVKKCLKEHGESWIGMQAAIVNLSETLESLYNIGEYNEN